MHFINKQTNLLTTELQDVKAATTLEVFGKRVRQIHRDKIWPCLLDMIANRVFQAQKRMWRCCLQTPFVGFYLEISGRSLLKIGFDSNP